MKNDPRHLATALSEIPVLDTYNFLRRFGRPGQFPSSMDLNKFAFERLENFGAKILRPMPWEFVRSKSLSENLLRGRKSQILKPDKANFRVVAGCLRHQNLTQYGFKRWLFRAEGGFRIGSKGHDFACHRFLKKKTGSSPRHFRAMD